MTDAGLSGEQYVFTGFVGDDGTLIRWQKRRNGEPTDSGSYRQPPDFNGNVRELIASSSLRAEMDSLMACTHCGQVAGAVRTDTSVLWYVREYRKPADRRLERTIEMLLQERR